MSVATEKATLQVSFSKEKLEALKFYMNEKNTTVEKELQGHIKSIYEKYVPAATRRYLDRNDSAEHQQAEVIVSSQETQPEESSTRTAGTRGRRRNSRTHSEDLAEPVQVENTAEGEERVEQSEDESQGMTMSM